MSEGYESDDYNVGEKEMLFGIELITAFRNTDFFECKVYHVIDYKEGVPIFREFVRDFYE